MNEVTLTLDQNDLAVIANALGDMPLKFAKATFDKINQQVAAAAQAEQATEEMPGGTD